MWIEFMIHQRLCCWQETTPPLPHLQDPLLLRPPHHDVAFEEEGWLQANAKLLGTRACNVTGREEKAELNQRSLGSVVAMKNQEGLGRRESEP